MDKINKDKTIMINEEKETNKTTNITIKICFTTKNNRPPLEGSALKHPEFIALVFQGNEKRAKKNEVVKLRSLAKPHRPLGLLSSIALSCRMSKSQILKCEFITSLKNSLLVDFLEFVSRTINQSVGCDIVDNSRQATGLGSNRLNCGRLKNVRRTTGEF